jgi:hypothetical protein
MAGGCMVVPLLDGVHSRADVAAHEYRSKIHQVPCWVLLPGPRWTGRAGELLEPPPREGPWPASADWGMVNAAPPGAFVTFRSLGLVLMGDDDLGEGGIDRMSHAVVRWRRLLRDWLAVLADGPTDFLAPADQVVWVDPKPRTTILGDFYWPTPVSVWQWDHALDHVEKGDEPPLARALLTAANRAAANGDWRAAVVDAATACEVALTAAISAGLSAEASSRVTDALIRRSRMLGARLALAREIGLTVPENTQADLVDCRNAVVHHGADMTEAQAQKAIQVAREILDDHEPLPTDCHEPERLHDFEPIMRDGRGFEEAD